MALGAGLAITTREFIRLDDSITQAGAKFKDIDVTASTYKDTLKELSGKTDGKRINECVKTLLA